jgi:membrane-anchored mycosin MYCP
MGENASQRINYELFRTNEIVVAIPHLATVTTALRDLSVNHEEPSADDDLGLALVRLPTLGADIARLPGLVELADAAQRAYALSLPKGSPVRSIGDLDVLMYKMRTDSAGLRCGWVPTMGKNRFLECIEPFGEINGGGKRRPTVKAPPESLVRALGSARAASGVRVGLVDTKIRYHNDLPARIRTEPAAHPAEVRKAEGTEVWEAHGTFGAGLILSKAPHAELVTDGAIDDTGQANAWDVAVRLMRFLTPKDRVDILNMSWGAVTDDGAESLLLSTALERLSHAGIVLVAAAGNLGNSAVVPPRSAVYPAAHPDVIGVGAVDRNGEPAEFTPDAAVLPWVRTCELGVDVVSTYYEDLWAQWSGTSFAAAIFTGKLAALTEKLGDAHAARDELLGE